MDNPHPNAGPMEKEIFMAALDHTTLEAREVFLDGACRADTTLRRKVEAMLADHLSLDGFMAAPAAGEAPTGLAEVPTTEKPGDRIGRYKLLEKIGEGGMGVVYMAEQTEPVVRKVALKIIKLGMDTRQVVARFEAERQALALMEHPNIAKVLDAGATDSGRPFFVMELVQGIAITDFCDQNQLSAEARIKLFIPVCQAIQSAHQKGIIHRDLKPSNVLVTLNDGVPHPMVIDFGVAKATNQKLTKKTLFTNFATMIGTPAYMSPEQAEMSKLDVDTRSDIYSLGVLLYELLTGTTPFPEERLRSLAYGEMQRIIVEEEPERPSTRLRKTALTGSAAQLVTRHASLATDLDWIVMKCLEKDRSRRYETANGLAADIQRHLSNEPIVARPPSRVYQFRKLARRNRLAFAAAAVVLAALLVGLTLSTWAFVRERNARRHAAIEAAKSRQVAEFLKDMIGKMKPSAAMGRDTTLLREFADQTFESLGKGLANQPEVEIELRVTLGKLFNVLGDYGKAEAIYRETLPRMRALPNLDQAQLADLLRDFTEVLNARDKGEEAEELARQALAIGRKLRGDNHDDVTSALHLLADALKIQFKYAEAEKLQLEALAISRKLHGPEHSDVASQLFGLALQYSHQGRAADAEPLFREALAMRKRLRHDAHPSVLEVTEVFAAFQFSQEKHDEAAELFGQLLSAQRRLLGNENRMVALTLSTLAGTLLAKRPADALPLAREALALRKRLYGEEHVEVAMAANDLGVALRRLNQNNEAERLFREALGITRKTAPKDFKLLNVMLKNLSQSLEAQQRIAEAEVLDGEAVNLARENAANDPAQLEQSLYTLADTVYRQNKYAEAEPIYREAIQRCRSRMSPDAQEVLKPTASLARLLADWAWAERTNAVTADVRKLTSNSEVRRAKSEVDQSLVTSAAASPLERAHEAERLLRECLAFQLKPKNSDATVVAFLGITTKFEHRASTRSITNTEPWRIDATRSRLGGAVLSVAVSDPVLSVEARKARLMEAESLLIEGNDALQQSTSADRNYKRHALERLVRLYEAWNKPGQAAEWKQKLDTFNQQSTEKIALNPEAPK